MLISGGADCHPIPVVLRSKNPNGKDAEAALEQAGLTCNKNGMPSDPWKLQLHPHQERNGSQRQCGTGSV
ncbi:MULTISPECIES: hypothetical protein [Mesorhizobium]|uniref:Serine hydroxymethyltransferase-like domain-containing protein n=1 Tax=Mesorhizobium japonicum TaxID=2066070 RepID=A0A3M9X0F0_9HYPH|nr:MULTISPECIES: hypothetical protein [Mesorhizobium]RNJ41176.1 hypothetical protein DNR46_35710 [Mesorhizobium japonicum]